MRIELCAICGVIYRGGATYIYDPHDDKRPIILGLHRRTKGQFRSNLISYMCANLYMDDDDDGCAAKHIMVYICLC